MPLPPCNSLVRSLANFFDGAVKEFVSCSWLAGQARPWTSVSQENWLAGEKENLQIASQSKMLFEAMA